jgi:glycosyltransferase involved in cell wall biosynthesis
MVGHVAAAATRIAESCPGMLLLTLGAGARLVDVAGIETYAPGEIPAAELAALIGASDLFLAPLIDGVSARRTSAMAALQHGVAVVATCGPLTDAILERSGALVLCHADDEQAFAHAAAAVARDPARRKALARTGGALYARTFAWPPVARRLVEALELE